MAGRAADIFIKDSLCFAMDVEVFGVKTITYVSICYVLPTSFLISSSLSLSLSGLQLVCKCQEATEEHGEAARSELGAQDQALQQICSGQRGEAERQQRRQLLRRYGSSVDFFSLPKFHFKVRRGLCPAENSQSCPDHSSTTKMGNCPAGPDLHRLFT